MSTRKEAQNLGEVRDQLCEIAATVMEDRRQCSQVHESANALGKAVGACKLYLEYCKLSDAKPSGTWSKFIAN